MTGSLTISNASKGSTYKAYKLADLGIKDGKVVHAVLNETYLNAGLFQKEGNESKTYWWDVLTGEVQDEGYAPIKDVSADGGLEAVLSEASQKIANILAEKLRGNSTLYGAADVASATVARADGDAPDAKTDVQFSDLKSGYYLIIETDTDEKTSILSTVPILAVVKGPGESRAAKTDIPTVTKVIEKNNSDFATSTEDIGDEVTYRLDAKVPKYPDEAENICFALTDTISKGLTLNTSGDGGTGNVVLDKVEGVSADGNSVTTLNPPAYSVSEATNVSSEGDYKDGKQFTVTFNYESIKQYAYVRVTYKATLNKDCVVEKAHSNKGNPNKVHLTYSNNYTTTDKYTTPDVEVRTYTYRFNIFKFAYDADGTSKNPLKNAWFAVYKEKEDGTKEYVEWYNNNQDDGNLISAKNEDSATNEKYPFVVKTDESGYVYLYGLDEGTYKIEEVKAPDGYNPIEDVAGTFTVGVGTTDNSAQEIIQSGTEAKAHTAKQPTGVFTVKESAADDAAELDKVEIENTKDITLPSTGGIGTTIFYVLGALLVVIAGVVLVTRRRMNGK